MSKILKQQKFHKTIFGRKPKQYFGLAVNVLENDWSGTKRGMVALLFWQLHVDNC